MFGRGSFKARSHIYVGRVPDPLRLWLVHGDNFTYLPRRREKQPRSGRQWMQLATMNRISMILLLLCGFVALVSANSPTFCKCTCFKNSTIVALGPQKADGEPPGNAPPSSRDTSSSSLLNKRAASSSCSQCTKAFCLSRGIDFCSKAKDEDVQTMCFQRDSNKDRVIVWGFLLGTSGLLGNITGRYSIKLLASPKFTKLKETQEAVLRSYLSLQIVLGALEQPRTHVS
ncbi:uncharacterized protein CLUP02_16874 [Colletotrichum lupini]|uniref:Uncharacterized protein n=1 Tax=Colletotrichum lupini TaxID=145971 RepID=A0A9Q8WQK7_9PEZI|nr:uncharacterized protein CLUP02_16874 [Colletotrichum lupini]UQC91340.1 hypothetical protein CLUP02_16874 [Colletotrichum lupini]